MNERQRAHQHADTEPQYTLILVVDVCMISDTLTEPMIHTQTHTHNALIVLLCELIRRDYSNERGVMKR